MNFDKTFLILSIGLFFHFSEVLQAQDKGIINLQAGMNSYRYTDNSTSNSISYAFSVDNKVWQKVGFFAINLKKNLHQTSPINRRVRNFRLLKATQYISYAGAIGIMAVPPYVNGRNPNTIEINRTTQVISFIGLAAIGFVSFQIGWKQLEKAVDEHNEIVSIERASTSFLKVSPALNQNNSHYSLGMRIGLNF